jgi:hypothetical protein
MCNPTYSFKLLNGINRFCFIVLLQKKINIEKASAPLYPIHQFSKSSLGLDGLITKNVPLVDVPRKSVKRHHNRDNVPLFVSFFYVYPNEILLKSTSWHFQT